MRYYLSLLLYYIRKGLRNKTLSFFWYKAPSAHKEQKDSLKLWGRRIIMGGVMGFFYSTLLQASMQDNLDKAFQVLGMALLMVL